MVWATQYPVSLILCRFTDLPLTAVFFAVQATEIIKMCIGIAMLRSGTWARNVVNATAIEQ